MQIFEVEKREIFIKLQKAKSDKKEKSFFPYKKKDLL